MSQTSKSLGVRDLTIFWQPRRELNWMASEGTLASDIALSRGSYSHFAEKLRLACDDVGRK